MDESPYGDIRDTIIASPNFGHHGYAVADLFPVRHEIIQKLEPKPTSVFEFGTLLGYFLLTACDAAPITRVGWIDVELDVPDSNRLCEENICDFFEKRGGGLAQLFYHTKTRNCKDFGRADLVQVDGAHSYADCLTDLIWAMQLHPKTIFVDDYTAIQEVKDATDEFCRWQGLTPLVHKTVNGLAVIHI